MERDSTNSLPQTCRKHFNSHAHVERDIPQAVLDADAENFNSHAHVERDANETIANAYITISTHTLTWSVTILLIYIRQTRYISTHTLTWSVTPLYFLKRYSLLDFNSHAHVERDF